MSFADELGGEAALCEADKAMVRLAAAMTVQSETLQASIVRGDAVDQEQFVRVTNSLTRALGKIRQKGSPAPAPALRDYLASRSSA